MPNNYYNPQSHNSTARARSKKASTLAAACEANQAALERLAAKRERANTNFGYTIKRAMESLQKATHPIQTYDEAVKLSYVGPSIARMLLPPEPKRPRAKTTAKEAPIVAGTTDIGESQITRKRPPPPPVATKVVEKKSKKQTAFEQAQGKALNWKNKRIQWRVILLVDIREKEKESMCSTCQQSGIPAEERPLPIGDMAWIARGTQDGTVVAELLLGTVVERKTVSDLKASLFGRRYMEQRKRLKEGGIPQVFFLIEGDIHKDQPHCPSDTLKSVVWEIRLHTEFQVLHTKHLEDTVNTLKRMHRRILQRTFPAVFEASEALPNFNPVGASSASTSEQIEMLGQRRRYRRKRYQSLMEMSFDTDPTPPFGEERFMTYEELKAMVERDRELTFRRVGNLHAFMIKQVATVSDRKVSRLQELYPTASHLLDAYDACPQDQRTDMVKDVVISEGARTCKIGDRSSRELHVAYGLATRDDEAKTSVGRVTEETQRNSTTCTVSTQSSDKMKSSLESNVKEVQNLEGQSVIAGSAQTNPSANKDVVSLLKGKEGEEKDKLHDTELKAKPQKLLPDTLTSDVSTPAPESLGETLLQSTTEWMSPMDTPSPDAGCRQSCGNSSQAVVSLLDEEEEKRLLETKPDPLPQKQTSSTSTYNVPAPSKSPDTTPADFRMEKIATLGSLYPGVGSSHTSTTASQAIVSLLDGEDDAVEKMSKKFRKTQAQKLPPKIVQPIEIIEID